jgi:hypothetical protein
MDMKFVTWNVRSLFRTGLLKMVARDLGKCKLDLLFIAYRNSDGRRVAHRDIHSYTWASPEGKIHNKIDHVLIDRALVNTVMNILVPQRQKFGKLCNN